jgi:hypothetical protein
MSSIFFGRILQQQWCDRQGSVDEVRSKLQMRHEGAAKRERAIAYALSHQVYMLQRSLSFQTYAVVTLIT